MVGRDNWLSIGHQPPEDIYEHGTLLHVNVKEMLTRVQKKETMPPAVAEQWLNDYYVTWSAQSKP